MYKLTVMSLANKQQPHIFENKEKSVLYLTAECTYILP
jgi:hypothetical protein